MEAVGAILHTRQSEGQQRGAVGPPGTARPHTGGTTPQPGAGGGGGRGGPGARGQHDYTAVLFLS